MAKFELRLSSRIQKETGRAEVMLRYFHSDKFNLRAKSGIFISPGHFEYYIDKKKTQLAGVNIPGKVITATMDEAIKKGYSLYDRGEVVVRNRIETDDKIYHDHAKRQLDELRATIEAAYELERDRITADWLQKKVDVFHHPEMINTEKEFFPTMEEFIIKKSLSRSQIYTILSLMKSLSRYERFVQATDRHRKKFTWNIEAATGEDIEDFMSYLRNEKALFEEYPNLFAKLLNNYPFTFDMARKRYKVDTRGQNSMSALMKRFRAFWLWMLKNNITMNNPFRHITIDAEKYGTPYYLTLEERNKIADFDLSGHPHLAIQRDIFIFQCCIGCRVSDLLKLTPADVIDGEVNYIPRKTKGDKPETVRVPLNHRATMLVEKYKGMDKHGKLFPFTSIQTYNENLKDIFTLCDITRLVTVIDSVTGKDIKRPINELASSHMARRTFIGNLYKKVKDPNLIGKMSGHVEGSKAFARYRDIDKETRIETVALID